VQRVAPAQQCVQPLDRHVLGDDEAGRRTPHLDGPPSRQHRRPRRQHIRMSARPRSWLHRSWVGFNRATARVADGPGLHSRTCG